MLIDDFSSSSLAPLNNQSSAIGTTWSAPGSYSVAADPTNPGNQILQANMAGTNQFAFLPLGVNEIANNSQGTLFFRYRREGAINANVGLTNVDSPAAFGDYRVQLNTQPGAPSTFQVRDGSDFTPLDSPSFVTGTWYHIWMTADNSSDEYQVHILDTGTGAGETFQFNAPAASLSGVNDTFDFRAPVGEAIDRFLLGSNDTSASVFYIDNIYVDNTGFNLTNPTVPEPGRALLLAVAAGLVLIRRQRPTAPEVDSDPLRRGRRSGGNASLFAWPAILARYPFDHSTGPCNPTTDWRNTPSGTAASPPRRLDRSSWFRWSRNRP